MELVVVPVVVVLVLVQATELQLELEDFGQWRCIYRGPPHALKFPLISLFQWGKEVLGSFCLLFRLRTITQSPCSSMKLTWMFS